MRSLGVSATLISGHEIMLALEAGFEPTSLMYNGGGKYPWETRLAVEHNLLINVDSVWDLRQTIEICQKDFKEPRQARVMLRLNLNIDPAVHKFVNTGTAESKFGLSREEADQCLQILAEPGCPVELVGLHSHLGSTIYQSDVFRASLEKLLEFQSTLIQRGFSNAKMVNIGGGLGIDYRANENQTKAWRCETQSNQAELKALKDSLTTGQFDTLGNVDLLKTALSDYIEERISFSDLQDTVTTVLAQQPHLKQQIEEFAPCLLSCKPNYVSPDELIQSISDLLAGREIKLILEPGRSLVANSCVVLARVLGCKQNTHKKFAIVDASMTEIIRPCLYSAYHHVSIIEGPYSRWQPDSKAVYDVVGPVCESSDFIAKDRLLPDPTGALAVVHDVGAYCYSMASNYNIRMRPAEIMVDGSTCCLIRRPDTFDDFMAPYRNLQ
ncbi:uncharacterized protein LOC131943720 isoform X1 [Physella acuta]|nr:uncharacterized protein LOC131943720 isoform X1 [Physella acuta]